MIRKSVSGGAHGGSRQGLRALLVGTAILLAGAGPALSSVEDNPSSAEQPSGFVEGAKGAGRAVGLAFHDIGQGAKRIGLEIGHGAAHAGREIGRGAAKVGREIGHAAREGGRAFARAVRGDEREE